MNLGNEFSSLEEFNDRVEILKQIRDSRLPVDECLEAEFKLFQLQLRKLEAYLELIAHYSAKDSLRVLHLSNVARKYINNEILMGE